MSTNPEEAPQDQPDIAQRDQLSSLLADGKYQVETSTMESVKEELGVRSVFRPVPMGARSSMPKVPFFGLVLGGLDGTSMPRKRSEHFLESSRSMINAQIKGKRCLKALLTPADA